MAAFVVAVDPVGEPAALDALGEPDPRIGRLGAVAGRVQQDPPLGFAKRRAEVPPCPRAGRVGVERHLAGRGEQLDQDSGDRAPAPGELRADHLLGQGLDELGERDGAGAGQADRAEALGTAVGVVVAGPGAGAHPVLRPPVVGAPGKATERPGHRAALIEAVQRVIGERQRPPDRVGQPAGLARHRMALTLVSNSPMAADPGSAPISRS